MNRFLQITFYGSYVDSTDLFHESNNTLEIILEMSTREYQRSSNTEDKISNLKMIYILDRL